MSEARYISSARIDGSCGKLIVLLDNGDELKGIINAHVSVGVDEQSKIEMIALMFEAKGESHECGHQRKRS